MNSIPVQYFATIDPGDDGDWRWFVQFVCEHVKTWRDVEALCLYCDLDDDKFRYMQEHFTLPKSVIRKFRDRINWRIVEYGGFDDAFVDEMAEYIDWDAVVLFCHKVTEDCLERNAGRISFALISAHRVMSVGFMRKFRSELGPYWKNVTVRRMNDHRLDDGFLDEFYDVIDWKLLSNYGGLTEDQIWRHRERIAWSWISVWRKWTSSEMDRFADFIDREAIRKNGSYRLSGAELERAVGGMKSAVGKMRLRVSPDGA